MKLVPAADANQKVFQIFSSAKSRALYGVPFGELSRQEKVQYVQGYYGNEVFYHQVEALDVFTNSHERNSTLNASRQTGKGQLFAWTQGLNAQHNLYPALDDTTKVISLANKESQSLIVGARLRGLLEANWNKTQFFWDRAGSTKTHLVFKKEAGINSRLMGTVDYQTANPKAFGEGFTASIIYIDEAGRLDAKVFSEVIIPFGGSTGARTIIAGVSRGKGPFYDACQSRDYRHIHLPWDKVETYRRALPVDLIDYYTGKTILETGLYPLEVMPLSLKKVLFPTNPICHLLPTKFQKEKRVRLWDLSEGRMTESDFKSQYCVAPDTKVLTADLHYIRADQVTKGMKLVGFDEERPASGAHRQYKESEVLDVGLIQRPCYQLTLSDGTIVTSSSEHRWLVSTPGKETKWKTTEQLTTTDRIVRLVDTWEQDTSYEAGYLAGVFDGEAHLLCTGPGHWTLTFAQNEGFVLSRVREYLAKLGFTYTERKNDAISDAVQLKLAGGRAKVLEFLGRIRPVRLLAKFNVSLLGSIGRHDRKQGGAEHPLVASKEYVGVRDVIAMKTSTATFVAEGLASHNCLEWLAALMAILQLEDVQRIFESSDYAPPDQKEPGTEYWYGFDLGGARNMYASGTSNKDTAALSIWRKRDGIKEKVFCDELYSTQPDEAVAWLLQYVHPQQGIFPCRYGAVDVTGAIGALTSEKLVQSRLPVVPVIYNRTEETTKKNWKNAMFDYFEIETKGGRVRYPKKEITDELDPDTLTPKNPLWYKAREQWEIIEREITGGINARISAPVNEHDDHPNADVLCVFAMDRPHQFEDELRVARQRAKAPVRGQSVLGQNAAAAFRQSMRPNIYRG